MKPKTYSWSTTTYHYTIDMREGNLIALLIMTKYGFVRVSIGYGGTFIQFIWNGMVHMQETKREYSKRYAVTLAKRFVKEITEQ